MPRRLVESTFALLIAVAGVVATVPAMCVHAGWRKREPVYVIPTDLPNHGYHATRWHRWPEEECIDEGIGPTDVGPVLPGPYLPVPPTLDDPRFDGESAGEDERTAPNRIDVPIPSSRPATSRLGPSAPAAPPRYRTQEWTPRHDAIETSRVPAARVRVQPASHEVLIRPRP